MASTLPPVALLASAPAPSSAAWVAEFHRVALQRAERDVTPDGPCAAVRQMQVTDCHHLALDRVAAELNAARNGWSVEESMASEVTGTAIQYVREALDRAADPLELARTLHTVIRMNLP